MEDTTDGYVKQSKSQVVKAIHKKVVEVRESKEMEVEYMTLYQRDMENIELGREEGIPETRIVEKLQLRFHLDPVTAANYLKKCKQRE